MNFNQVKGIFREKVFIRVKVVRVVKVTKDSNDFSVPNDFNDLRVSILLYKKIEVAKRQPLSKILLMEMIKLYQLNQVR